MSEQDERVLCVVEIPQGSRNKYEYDRELGGIRLDRLLFSSVAYPMDYGYVPETIAEDGDPLDVMVCVSRPTFPGCRIWARPIALFRMEDEKGPDNKVLCVPTTDPTWRQVRGLDDLPDQTCSEIAHFFSIYKEPQGLKMTVFGWEDADHALASIVAARRRFTEAGRE
jgi:inorganic pyrophosphatase